MNEADIVRLYDHALVAAATEEHAIGAKRHGDAVASHVSAVAEHARAERASERAVMGDGDPLAAEKSLHEAAMAMNVAAKVMAHHVAALAKLAGDVKLAKAKAALPIAEKGFRDLYLASVKHDAANALLAEADADRATAVATCLVAHGHGLTHVSPSLSSVSAHVMMPAERRRVFMIGNRLNPETGKFG